MFHAHIIISEGHVRFERNKKLRSCLKIRMMPIQYWCLCLQFVNKVKMGRIILFTKIGNLEERNVFRRRQFRSLDAGSVSIKVAKTLYFQSIMQATLTWIFSFMYTFLMEFFFYCCSFTSSIPFTTKILIVILAFEVCILILQRTLLKTNHSNGALLLNVKICSVLLLLSLPWCDDGY